MATPGRTQKQIADRYKGNLGYYKKKHPWRVARWCVSFLAISGGIAGIIAFYERGNEEFFDVIRYHTPGEILYEFEQIASYSRHGYTRHTVADPVS